MDGDVASRNGVRRTEPTPRIIAQRLRRLVRLWPWRASVIAWLLVVIPVGLVRGHFSGIYGFSTANYGWLAFTLVGGSGLAWRLAGTPPVIQAAPGGMT